MSEELRINSAECQGIVRFMNNVSINTLFERGVRDQLYVSYTDDYLINNYKSDRMIGEALAESVAGEIATYVHPVAEVVQNLTEDYDGKIIREQFRTVTNNGIQSIRIEKIPVFWTQPLIAVVPDVKMNIKIIDDEMTGYGYVRVRLDKQRDDEGRSWYFAVYNPNPEFAENIRDVISTYRLYHFSPETNHDDIMDTGLIPSHGGRTYTYPDERVFFYVMYKKRELLNSFINMMAGASRKVRKADPYFSGIYNMYELLIENMPSDTKVYLDPNARDCVYLTSHISPEFVRWTKETVDFENFRR